MAAGRWVGRGDKEGGDGAAVDAMRQLVSSVSMRGVVVIGEGEKDEAPMLFNGEEVGNGDGPECDFAVDPVDGTTLMAKGMPNAISVLAVAERGAMFDPSAVFYMEKIAVGPDAADVIDITAPVAENIKRVAKVKKASVSDVTVCILDRPRHAELIQEVRDTGARIRLISDGDVAGAIAAARPESGTDMLDRHRRNARGHHRRRRHALHGWCAAGPAGTHRRRPSARRPSTPATTSIAILDHRRSRLGRERLLLRHRRHRRRPAARRPLLRRRRPHPVHRDALASPAPSA